MASKKRDLEIIYNLVWKNRLLGDDRSNIVGVYDIPSTTLNWEKFKSYLLKNSGTSTEHIRVYYVDVNDRELPIESQEDFQLALYSFRKRARDGDINMLKLEKVANPKNTAVKRKVAKPREELVDKIKMDSPPEWFTRYMRKFKKEMMEEITTTMMKINSSRKSRSEPMKMPAVPLELTNKDLKHLKSEKKLENKLEKLDLKTFKIKTLKQALKDVNESRSTPLINEIEYMNVSLATNVIFPMVHLLGGETYMHSWEIINCGMLPWDKNTVIQFAWGSKDLVPIERVVECPHLKPGEIGTISTYYSVPEIPGLYECYWHYLHHGKRFGKWLGLQVTVDDIKKRKHDTKVESAVEIESNIKTENDVLESISSLNLNENDDSGMVEPDEHIKPENTEADNISIISLNGSNSSKDGYVMIYGNESAEQENAQAIVKEEKTEEQEPVTHNNEEINVAEDVVTDYAFIYYNGEKYPLDKKYLKEDYFQQAETEPTVWIKPENATVEIPPEEANNEGLSSDPMIQSMLSSCENRLFIFPQQSPGFEVVQAASTPQVSKLEELELTTNSVNETALQEDPQNTEFHSADEYEDQNKNIASAAISNSFNLGGSESVSNRSCSHHPHDSPRCCFKDRSMPESHQNMTHHDDYECEYSSYSSRSSTSRPQNIPQENLLTGAALLASSAMSTARSMMDMVMQSGKWVNGHWVSENPNSKRESALLALSEMGFNDRDLNATLLARYNDDVCKVVSELIQ